MLVRNTVFAECGDMEVDEIWGGEVYCTFWQEIKTFFSTTLQHIHHWDGFTSPSTAGRHRFSHTIRL